MKQESREFYSCEVQWRIGCAEERPIPVKCDKCEHEFEEFEQIWSINQQGEYMSVFDGDWISKRLCDSCISWLMDENDNISEIESPFI